MDNMKPLLDAVTDDVNDTSPMVKGATTEATATATTKDNTVEAKATGGAHEAKVIGDKAGRQKCHDSTEGGQRGSSCGRRGPDGPPWWASMGWACGPTMQQPFGHPCGPPMSMRHPFGPSAGNSFGPRGGHSFGPRERHPFGPPGGHPFGPSGGHPFEPPGGHPFGPSGGHPFGPSGGPNECMWGRGPPFMNGPSEYACPWDRGMPPMNDFSHWGNITGPSSMHGPPTFGPMMCPWDTNLPCEDEIVADESDEWDAGKESAGDAGKDDADTTGKDEPNPPKQKAGTRTEMSERPRRMCPWCDGMRRRRMRCSSRHANTSCRRHDPFSMYRRCRRGPWAQSRYAPWAAFSGDCCQQAAPTGWGECPYPSPLYPPFSYNWSGESNTDPDTDNQKQDGDQPTPEECCRFFKGAPAWFRRHGGCCGGRRWQGGPSRNKMFKMLTRRRNMLKEKLQRIESMLDNMEPSEEEAKETTVGGDASPQQAASQMETGPGKTLPRKTNTDREWEMIADSE